MLTFFHFTLTDKFIRAKEEFLYEEEKASFPGSFVQLLYGNNI